MKRTGGPDRWLLGNLARRIFSARTAEGRDPTECDNLLLIRVDERVGNLLCLQQLADALKQNRPGVRMGLLASRRMEEAAGSLAGFDRLHLLDKRWFFRRHLAWRRVMLEVRAAGYQVAIDSSAWHEFSFTHAALTYWSGAPVRIGYRRGTVPNLTAGIGDDFYTHAVEPGAPDEYDGRQRMRLLRPLGITAEPPRLRTTLGHSAGTEMSGWMEKNCPGRPRVGLWAGGRKRERRTPVYLFVELGNRLRRELGAELIVLWGPGEEALRDRLVRALEGAVAAPPTDLERLAALLRGLGLMVANDTGPMHLSVAVGTPTLALFASGEPTRWGHPGPGVINMGPAASQLTPERLLSACLELLPARSN